MAHASWGGPCPSIEMTRITGIAGLPLYVRPEVSAIFQWLVLALQQPGVRKKGAARLSSDGGMNCRRISGSTKMSNHAWSLAIDVNAATNPYQRGPLVTDFVVGEVHKILEIFGGNLRWGGDYSGKKDAMHFEWVGSRSAAADCTSRIQRGLLILPGQKAGSTGSAPAFSVGAKGAKVKEIEIRLRLLGYDPGVVDGIYTKETKAAVEKIQGRLGFTGKDVDGIVGHRTLERLDVFPLLLKATRDTTAAPHDRLSPGTGLLPGWQLTSPNGRHTLRMQTDGNVALYHGRDAAWSTRMRGTQFTMQADGNLVLNVTADGQGVAVWSAQTYKSGGPGSYLRMQDDGNAVVYARDGKAVWSTGTAVGA